MKADKNSNLIELFLSTIGDFFMFIFGQTTDLTCAKTEAGTTVCSKEVTFLGVIPLSSNDFREVYRAEVEESCDDEGCSYRIVLTTIDGTRPLTSVYTSNWLGKNEMAAQINTFIGSNNNRGELALQEKSGLWASLLSMVFLLVGLYQLLLKGLIQPNQVG